MSWFPSWEGIIIATVVMVMIRVVWIWRKFEDHHFLRFIGWPEPYGRAERREYFWSGTSGVSRAEIERSLSPEYARRYGRLMTPRARQVIIMSNVATWLLVIYGGFDLPGSLGLSNSHGSLWGLVTIVAWWAARTSARAIADAPDELLDERLVALKNAAYYDSYRMVGVLISAMAVFAVGIDIAATDRSITLSEAGWTSLVFTLPFVSIWAFSALPSLVLISRRVLD